MIRVADWRTKQTVDVALEQQGMESVQRLMMKACKAFRATRIVSLMVGDLNIPREDWDRHSVDVYLLLGEPWMVECFWKVRGTPDNIFHEPIYITGLTAETNAITNLGPQSTVWDLRMNAENVIGHEGHPLRMLHAGKQLEDERSLSDYGIRGGSVIQVVLRLAGGGGISFGASFVDIDEKSMPSRREWSTRPVPSWREATRGLCIEGTCTNPRCKSKGSLVIVKLGYTRFSLLEQSHLCCCPACGSHVEPVTCAFNNCYWNLWGRKRNSPSEDLTTVKITEQYADDAWHRYDPNENGKAQWSALFITANAEREKKCCKCRDTVNEQDEITLPCGHSGHDGCNRKPAECHRRPDSMTEFQRRRSAE